MISPFPNNHGSCMSTTSISSSVHVWNTMHPKLSYHVVRGFKRPSASVFADFSVKIIFSQSIYTFSASSVSSSCRSGIKKHPRTYAIARIQYVLGFLVYLERIRVTHVFYLTTLRIFQSLFGIVGFWAFKVSNADKTGLNLIGFFPWNHLAPSKKEVRPLFFRCFYSSSIMSI